MSKKISEQNFLSNKKIGCDEEVHRLVKKTTKIIKNINISKILMCNDFEKLVPFNLWFRHDLYKILNHYQNNQNIRTRYFNNIMLTPVILNNDSTNLGTIKSFMHEMSLYQPFYPETFYFIWEFLQTGYLSLEFTKFLHIGKETSLGSVEATIFYYEKYQNVYQNNIYHVWLCENEKYSNYNYTVPAPKINYLEQAYKIKFISSTNELTLTKYHFISIDCISLFDDIFGWKNEEMDLHANLFYILAATKHLEKNGSMLIKLNMVSSKSWNFIFDIVHKFFREYEFIRPTTANPFSPNIYLFLNKFRYEQHKMDPFLIILKNLYRHKIYDMFYLNLESNAQNPILQKYKTFTKKWVGTLAGIVKNFQTKIPKIPDGKISKWHASNDLMQIKHITSDFVNEPVKYMLSIISKQLKIKPIAPNTFYGEQFYKKLVEKRSELNYYKRIMDTKPSQIFINRTLADHKQNYLLTWEQVTSQIDMYKNIKYTLKDNYGAEMVTNAWIKMYELLNLFPELIPNNENIKTFHLCEAPGAFISAVNHYISSRNAKNGAKQKLEWYAQTIRPTNTGMNTDSALEDNFGLIISHPIKWLFGPSEDKSGDITHSKIIKWYASNPQLKDIDFMTSDAGLQCKPSELNEQESYLSKINMGQIICILACLPFGKSALFKTFLPMSEPLTISMIYLISHLFEKVTLTKPVASHSPNSEVYIILNKYKGIKNNILDILYQMLDDPKITSKTLLFESFDQTFIKSYTCAIEKLVTRQIKSLNKHYYYYYHIDETQYFGGEKEAYTNMWFKLNPICILNDFLLDNKIFNNYNNCNL
ncbi:MAG: putative FtsJ-like methyltransferase [Satyrvirus sp.]|uniref:Putative FtsJ-like methyltransferase n=1 Tax=Satyrvirus sp. TaxID=2487771 RepID=A0A3G5AET4_9VIRU|nr:MAG: putative FtsJ-like methyltransferase [Satyrvirus sp.]